MFRKQLFLFFVIGLLLPSCGFLFYNFRCEYDSDISIPNQTADTNLRYAVGQYIIKFKEQHSFYTRFATTGYDSLYLYGPDYHKLSFKITEMNQTTNIHFHYFGFNGSRKRPPHKLFIQALKDSLKIKFNATEKINRDLSNERE